VELSKESYGRSLSFPTDVRQDQRQSAYQWDDVNVPGSLLNFDETWSWTGVDLDTGPRTFSYYGWEDVPGKSFKVLNGNIVTSGSVYLNTNWNWLDETMNQNAKKADVVTVMIHEIGHPTGFNHPNSGCPDVSVMCPAYRVMRQLTQHDKSAMDAKY
jgi:hypothetical protein